MGMPLNAVADTQADAGAALDLATASTALVQFQPSVAPLTLPVSFVSLPGSQGG